MIIQQLIKNVWFRLIGLSVASVIVLMITSSLIQIFFINPIQKDLRNAKRGISRFQSELLRIEKEVANIQQQIDEKSTTNQGRYQHYYTLYSNPVRYINQFVLNQSKPQDITVLSSSVQPNTSLTSVEKELLKPYIKDFGISRMNNITKLFSITQLSLVASGSFTSIGQYLTNLNNLPVKFVVRNFELKNQNNNLVLSLNLAFIVYRMPDDA
tara:strand:- start:1037 stop:1672 length:636 start_codon:yes stop_codon:yes gene_type:complete